VHIFIARGNKLSNFCIYRKTLGRCSHKFSIISKQSRLMHNELGYQVKTHAISDMPREKKKYPANFPNFYFLLLINTCNMEITSYARQDQTCVSSMMPIQKNSRLTCFFFSSRASTCKVLSREIGGKTQLVPRLHTKYSK
jgi:hypothetical protein